MIQSPDTTFVLVTDSPYFSKAKRTIEDLRWRGKWGGSIVLLAIGFYPSQTWAQFMDVTVRTMPPIDTSELVNAWKKHPIQPMADERHTKKLNQWSKLYVFDTWFKQWARVVYLDAGLRVFNTVKPLLDLEWKGAFLAPDDTLPFRDKTFACQLDTNANPTVTKCLEALFGTQIYSEPYFMNCMWVYDTSLLDICNIHHLQQGMNEFPICMTNEMALMNLYFTFLHRVWKPFPEKTAEGKYLYGWSELNHSEKPGWQNFHFLKYPVTITLDCQ